MHINDMVLFNVDGHVVERPSSSRTDSRRSTPTWLHSS
jgi:hypothetical protein